jgi:hypothetical protein
VADEWCLPRVLTSVLYASLAFRQFSLNHGAKCFAHLFGFLFGLCGITFTTPALLASTSRNASMAAARASLSSANLAAVALNSAANSGDDVCDVHFVALALYSIRQSPVIHRYVLVSSSTALLLAGRNVGHVCLSAFEEEAAFEEEGRWEVVVGLAEVSGRWVESMSWSVMFNAL